MYTNGLGVKADYKKANDYYNKAIERGLKQATINKYVLLDKNMKLVEQLNMINTEMFDKNSPLFGIFNKIFNGYKLTSSSSEDLVNKYCGKWIDTGSSKFYSDTPPLSFYKIWYFQRFFDVEKDGVYGKKKLYAEAQRTCTFHDIVVDKFIYVSVS